jgi:heptaprenyl diphosphate synthase
MILLHSHYQSDLERMIELVKERTYNSYVDKYVTYPSIDLFSLHFTYLFLVVKGCPDELRDTICMSQMLIQLGLDSHEEVGNNSIIEDEQMKSRQLMILSGDYFSAHYYLLLTERNEFDLIGKWADAIIEMNESKTDLHHSRLSLSLEKLEELSLEIKGKLTTAVMNWYQGSELWMDIYQSLAYLINIKENEVGYRGDFKQRIKEVEEKLTQIDSKLVRSELTLWFQYIQEDQLVIEP